MPRYKLKQFEDALTFNKGMTFLASKSLGCSHTTMLAWLKKSPRLRELLTQYDGEVTDTTELKLYQKVLDGEAWAIQFRLRTKGRDRGYGEGLAVTGADGKPLLPIQIPDTPERLTIIMQIIQQIAPNLMASIESGDGNEPDNGQKLLAG